MNLHNFVLYNFEKIIPKLDFAKSSVSLSTAIVSTRASDRETVPPVENNRLKGWSVTSDPQVFRL